MAWAVMLPRAKRIPVDRLGAERLDGHPVCVGLRGGALFGGSSAMGRAAERIGAGPGGLGLSGRSGSCATHEAYPSCIFSFHLPKCTHIA
jgi:hypothetical protein